MNLDNIPTLLRTAPWYQRALLKVGSGQAVIAMAAHRMNGLRSRMAAMMGELT
jgi:hypothetical protein